MQLPIYLDNQATTPCDPRVVEAMLPYFTEEFGNSASVGHVFGQRAAAAVNQASQYVAELIGADDPKSIFFTSGSTEANNIATKSVMFGSPKVSQLIVTATEHKAVLDPAEFLASQGYGLFVLPVNKYAQVDPNDVAAAIKENTRLVSVLLANNEVGSLNDIKAIAKICNEREVLLHTDATQAVGRIGINAAGTGIDLLSLSGHKLYGPKGIGALYIRNRARRIKMVPLQHGGGHQNKIRSGTMPVALIVGLGEACRIAKQDFDKDRKHAIELSELLQQGLNREIEDLEFNGHPTERIATNIHLTIPGVNSEALLHTLKDSIAISTGAACTTAAPEPSHVLIAMQKSIPEINSSIRIGLGRATTREEILYAIEHVAGAVKSLRKFAIP